MTDFEQIIALVRELGALQRATMVLLVEKGIVTNEELAVHRLRAMARMDQVEAAMMDTIKKELNL